MENDDDSNEITGFVYVMAFLLGAAILLAVIF
jgi:hypothetical protein